MMDEQKLMEKVQKLLSLAQGNNNSEDEVKAATLKAQKLIAEYNLDMSKYTDKEIEKLFKLIKASHPNNNGYRANLAAILAPNFRCRTLYIGNDIHFFGREGEVDTCTEVFNTLYKVMRRGGQKEERRARSLGENTHGVANSYWAGFLKGLKDELDSQSRALMIIVPEETNKKFNERFPNLRAASTRTGQKFRGHDQSAYNTGYTDGRESAKKRTLESGKEGQ